MVGSRGLEPHGLLAAAQSLAATPSALTGSLSMVRSEGVEPSCLSAPPSGDGVSTEVPPQAHACLLAVGQLPHRPTSLTRRALGGSRTRNIRHLGPASLPRLEYEHKKPPPCAAASLGNQGSNLDSLASEASVLPLTPFPIGAGGEI